MNRENFKRVLDHIKTHPETWKQNEWHCGTSHCFAGHAQIMAGCKPNDATVRRDARVFLNLSSVDAKWLFSIIRKIEDFENMLSGKDGYDSDGYDSEGRDRAGYNHAGYDREGYNHEGYNHEGRNREGRDCKGYDREGYDCEGLDKNNQPKPGRG